MLLSHTHHAPPAPGQIDDDGNGTISSAEIESAIKRRLGNDAESLSRVDGLLSLGNDVMKTSIGEMSEKLAADAGRVVDLFKKWDENNDGVISRNEFHKAMPLLGLGNHVPAEVDALFTSYDVDGSNEITFRELYKMVKHNPDVIVKAEKKKKEEPKAEPVCDLEDLRKIILRNVERKGNHSWTNEVPNSVRSQLEKGRANPTIGYSILK